MKSAIQISTAGLGLAALLALGLAGCSNDQSRFSQMSKDQQIKTIQYQQDHPTPWQAAMVAKMRAGMGASQAAKGAKPGPPAMPATTPTQ